MGPTCATCQRSMSLYTPAMYGVQGVFCEKHGLFHGGTVYLFGLN
jgi:hypothetical protein